MTNKNQNKVPTTDSVDQIRNILFGEQIAIFESRFEQLESSLNKEIEDLSEKLSQSNNELISQINESNKKLQSDNNSLSQENADNIKGLEVSLNNKIIETEAEIINQLQSGLQNLDKKASHRSDLAELLKEMAEKLAD